MWKHLQPAEKRKAVSYRFGEKLGSGAFGTVYKAFDESNNVFAIKVLDEHGFKFPGALGILIIQMGGAQWSAFREGKRRVKGLRAKCQRGYLFYLY